jgi:hypothetical protein
LMILSSSGNFIPEIRTRSATLHTNTTTHSTIEKVEQNSPYLNGFLLLQYDNS